MIDRFGRTVTYLRVSVTDRCNFRCTYCMPERMTFLPRNELLSLEELDRLCTIFIKKGVNKIRITGGEPLVRQNIMELFRNLGRHLTSKKLDELTLTTNGSQLTQHAEELFEIGVRRVNISLDTLRPDRFKSITRSSEFDEVIKGIDAASKAGLAIKINTVALRNINDDEFDDLIVWCGEKGFDLTLIETMPLGEVDVDRSTDYLPLSSVHADLKTRWKFEDMSYSSGGPARYRRITNNGVQLGFITPLTNNFCAGCNRVRLTCNGTLYMCLGKDASKDLRTVIRTNKNNHAVEAAIDEAIGRKPKGHDFLLNYSASKLAVARHMSTTGG